MLLYLGQLFSSFIESYLFYCIFNHAYYMDKKQFIHPYNVLCHMSHVYMSYTMYICFCLLTEESMVYKSLKNCSYLYQTDGHDWMKVCTQGLSFSSVLLSFHVSLYIHQQHLPEKITRHL